MSTSAEDAAPERVSVGGGDLERFETADGRVGAGTQLGLALEVRKHDAGKRGVHEKIEQHQRAGDLQDKQHHVDPFEDSTGSLCAVTYGPQNEDRRPMAGIGRR